MIILGQFRPLLKRALFFKAAGAVEEIGSSLKPNHHNKISLSKSVILSLSKAVRARGQ